MLKLFHCNLLLYCVQPVDLKRYLTYIILYFLFIARSMIHGIALEGPYQYPVYKYEYLTFVMLVSLLISAIALSETLSLIHSPGISL